jgi:hypothetical protein
MDGPAIICKSQVAVSQCAQLYSYHLSRAVVVVRSTLREQPAVV